MYTFIFMKVKKEISFDLNLSTEEVNRLNMHSFLNVLNVIIGSLQLLGHKLDNKELFTKSAEVSFNILDSFKDTELALKNAENISNYKQIILDALDEAEKLYHTEPEKSENISFTRNNLSTVFDVVDVRVREILSRAHARDNWELHSIDLLIKNMKQVLEAIRENSRRKFNLSYDPENHPADTYLVLFRMEAYQGKSILMPPVLQDSFRDLIANARKYTPVGGTIKASIVQHKDELVLKVSDNGRGIPEKEIEKVVEYGLRGTNTYPSETKGGGFGLTKAYFVCRQFHGKMFIESEINAGTTISLHIPTP